MQYKGTGNFAKKFLLQNIPTMLFSILTSVYMENINNITVVTD